jgi:predicted DCC family thiol-disulfide oxidoreductase YuxK
VRQRPVLLYDADCRICRFTARTVARLDRERELALLPLQDPAAKPLLASLHEDRRLETWRLVRSDGALTGYGAGVPELLAATRLGRPAGRLLGLLPPGVLDAGYGFVARHRGRIGRFVPDGSAPRRFP